MEDTTQQKSFHARLAEPKQVTVSEAFNKLKAHVEAKAAACEAQKKKIAEAKAAYFDTTQYADIKKSLDSAAAIITNLEELDDAEWEEAIAEVKRHHREAREKLFARDKAIPLLTVAELACAGFLFASLRQRPFSE